MREHRIVTVVGAGGMGKTQLALAAAHALQPGFRHGAWLVDLASVRDAALVPAAIAQALGILLPAGLPLAIELARSFVLAGLQAAMPADQLEHWRKAGALLSDEAAARHFLSPRHFSARCTRTLPEETTMLNELYELVARRASEDSEYRAALLANPARTLMERHGIVLASGMQVRVVEEAANELVFRLPSKVVIEDPLSIDPDDFDENGGFYASGCLTFTCSSTCHDCNAVDEAPVIEAKLAA